MTNLERIRQMTEEELVKYLGTSAFCHKINVCRSIKRQGCDCKQCVAEWLKEEMVVE